jgi:hypothetical protein
MRRPVLSSLVSLLSLSAEQAALASLHRHRTIQDCCKPTKHAPLYQRRIAMQRDAARQLPKPRQTSTCHRRLRPYEYEYCRSARHVGVPFNGTGSTSTVPMYPLNRNRSEPVKRLVHNSLHGIINYSDSYVSHIFLNHHPHSEYSLLLDASIPL